MCLQQYQSDHWLRLKPFSCSSSSKLRGSRTTQSFMATPSTNSSHVTRRRSPSRHTNSTPRSSSLHPKPSHSRCSWASSVRSCGKPSCSASQTSFSTSSASRRSMNRPMIASSRPSDCSSVSSRRSACAARSGPSSRTSLATSSKVFLERSRRRILYVASDSSCSPTSSMLSESRSKMASRHFLASSRSRLTRQSSPSRSRSSWRKAAMRSSPISCRVATTCSAVLLGLAVCFPWKIGLRLQRRLRGGSWISKPFSLPTTLSRSAPQRKGGARGSSLKLICWSSGESTDSITSSWKCSFRGLRQPEREALSCVRLKLQSASWFSGLLGGAGGMLGRRGGPPSSELSCVRSTETSPSGDFSSCRICWQSCGRIWLVLRMLVSVQVWWPLIKLLYSISSTPALQHPAPTPHPAPPPLRPHCCEYANVQACGHQSLLQASTGRSMSRHEGRVDHLELLRAAYSQGRSVQRREEQLVFERGVRAELKQPTAWVATHSNYNYTLGALWLYLEHATHRLPTYIEALTDLDIRNVLICDRKEIEAYFIHGNPKTACISQQRRLELSTKSESRIREQPSSGFEACDAPSKRQKPDPLSGELQVIDFIAKFERPISSKSRSLRCPSKSLDPLLRLLHSGSGEQGRADEKRLRIGQFADGKKLPILIVPESYHPGNVGLANIQKLLAGGEYVEEPPRLPDHQRKCEIAVTMRGRRVGFEVCNNPRLMPPCEWPSVVAVFVQGRKHEFDGWPCADPALIFRQARGFLLRFAGTEEGEGLQWKVKQLILDRNVRYRDAAVQREILEDIEAVLFQPLDASSQM